MSDINLPPFYVGQEVIRLVDSNISGVKKGSKHIVASIKWCCAKWQWRIALIGVEDSNNGCCEHCRRTDTPKFAAKNFAPVEENFEAISFKEVIRKEKPLTCSN